MTTVDPTLAEMFNVFPTADDSGIPEDYKTCVTDDILTTTCIDIFVSAGGAILRCEFPGLASLASGDTIRIHSNGTPGSTDIDLYPYDDEVGVLATNKISVSTSADAWHDFTLTQAFIDDLFDQGGGTFAVRFAHDDEIGFFLSEVEGNLTPVTWKQEGYRWRDDDGSESGASWLQSQDVDITRAALTNTRLRMLMDATGNPPSQQYTLQVRRSDEGDGAYRAIEPA